MIAYVDASVVLRVVLGESGRLREWPALTSIVSSELLEIECLRTLDRIRLGANRSPEEMAIRRGAVYRLLEEADLVELSRPVLHRVASEFPTPLGTLDAIHLATAMIWREREGTRPVFATHAAALGLGAQAMGFAVIGL